MSWLFHVLLPTAPLLKIVYAAQKVATWDCNGRPPVFQAPLSSRLLAGQVKECKLREIVPHALKCLIVFKLLHVEIEARNGNCAILVISTDFICRRMLMNGLTYFPYLLLLPLLIDYHSYLRLELRCCHISRISSLNWKCVCYKIQTSLWYGLIYLTRWTTKGSGIYFWQGQDIFISRRVRGSVQSRIPRALFGDKATGAWGHSHHVVPRLKVLGAERPLLHTP